MPTVLRDINGKPFLVLPDTSAHHPAAKGHPHFTYNPPEPEHRSEAPVPQHHGGGFLHDLGSVAGTVGTTGWHLSTDLENAITGIPAGLVHVATHPIGSAKGIAKSEAYSWGPLINADRAVLEGDNDKAGKQIALFGNRFKEHPLSPVLDLATIATLGAAGVGKAATLVSKTTYAAKAAKASDLGMSLNKAIEAGHVEPLTRVEQLGRSKTVSYSSGSVNAPILTRSLSKNPYRRFQQEQLDSAGRKLAAKFPNTKVLQPLSEQGKYNRLHSKDAANRSAASAVAKLHQSKLADNLTSDPATGLFKSFYNAGKLVREDPSAVIKLIHPHARKQLEEQAHTLPHKDVQLFTKSGQLHGAATWTKNGVRVAGKFYPEDKVFIKPGKDWGLLLKDHVIPERMPIEEYVGKFGQRNVFDGSSKAGVVKLSRVHRTQDGLLTVPKKFAQSYSNEMGKSLTFLHKLPQMTTGIWKYMTLATAPRYFVNNMLGNAFMGMMTANSHAVRGFTEAYRQVHGNKKLLQDMSHADRMAQKHLGYAGPLDKWYGDLYASGFSRDFGKDLPHAKLLHGLAQGTLGITHKYAEDFLRRWHTASTLHAQPEIQALMQERRMPFHQAVDTLSQDPAFRKRIVENVNDTFGDYHHLTASETAIRKWVPFYTWDRAISRHVLSLYHEHPGRLNTLQRVGTQGHEDVQNVLGDHIPDFLKNSLPLQLLGLHGKDAEGRIRMLSTQGLNPYASAADVLNAVKGLTTGGDAAGSDIGSQLNPLVTGAVEYLSGQSLLTGAKKPHKGGLPLSVLESMALGTPPAVLAKSLIEGTPAHHVSNGKVKPFLFKKDRTQYGSSYLGVPYRELDLAAAEAAWKKSHRSKKKAGYAKIWGR